MNAKIDEIGDRIFRLSVFVPDIAPPAGFTFNHFLIDGDEPLLFHCGLRKMFPLLSAAVAKVIPLERLRWLSFGHFESDECGSMNEWLAAAPHAQVAHGMTGCMVSLNDMAARAPRILADGEVIDLGGKRLRYIDTPHVPHGWDAGVLFEETSGTLLCGDLFTHTGNGPRSPRATSWRPRSRPRTFFNTPASPVDRAGHPQAGRSCPAQAGGHARLVVCGRCRDGTAQPGRRIRQAAAAGAGRSTVVSLGVVA